MLKKIFILGLVLFLAFVAFALSAVLRGTDEVALVNIEQPTEYAINQDGQLMAGAVSVDITPPPGVPSGGYSTLGLSAQGVRTRLKARIFYLSDGQGESVALVQTDMASSSLLVHHKVASLIAAKTGIRARGVVVTGTHSHSSYGSHFHNDFYNKHFSNEPGLDTELLEEVSQRIADGIIQAYENRKPARIATGQKDIYGYNRNRMLEAYARNPGKDGIDLDDPDSKFKAVNPTLSMIRVDAMDDDGVFKPLGAFSSFSVHATAISALAETFNADLFAYAQRELEWAMQDKYATSWPVLHGLTTATQGDMAPALPEHNSYFALADVNFIEARKLGEGIGKEAIALFEALGEQLSDQLSLSSAAREVNIREQNRIGDVEICEQPLVGNTTSSGAYERHTPWLSALPFMRGGGFGSKRYWFGKDGCHGNKRIVGTSWLQPIFEPTESFPKLVFFQIIRLNDMAIMPLPYEITTESGRRIVERVKGEFELAGQPLKYGWVSSVSNGYFGYSTTLEEYEYQSYEGGSTLYGKNSTPYITAQLGALAKDMANQGEFQELAGEWVYELSANRFLPQETSDSSAERSVLQQAQKVAATADHEEDYIYFRWADVGLDAMDFYKGFGGVEQRVNDQWQPLEVGNHVIDDQGYDIEVRYLGNNAQGQHEYEMRWYNPLASGEYRFKVLPRNDQQSPLYSAAFE